MTHYMASFATSSLQCAMNQLSNHDHSRFLTRTNHNMTILMSGDLENRQKEKNICFMKNGR